MKLLHNLWLMFRWSSISEVTIAVCFGIVCGVGALIAPSLTIAGVIVIAAFTFGKVASRPMIMCYILIVFIMFTSAMPRGRIIPQLAPNELVLVLTFLLSALFVITRRSDKPIPTTILIALIVLILGTGVIPIISYQLRGVAIQLPTLLKFMAPVQYFLIFWIFMVIPRTHIDRLRIIQVMFLCATIAGVIGLLQAVGFPPVIQFLRTWYPSGHTDAAAAAGRITSVFGAWNTLGTFMMINLLVLLSLQNEPFPKIYKINMAVSAVICLLTLLGSNSYASLIFFVIGFILIKVIDPRGLKNLTPFFIALGMGIILLSPLLTTRFEYQFGGNDGLAPNTLLFRLEVWRTIYIPLIAQNPLWGSTPTFENLSFVYAESQYLFLMVRSGIISLIAFLTWLIATLAWLLVIIRGKYSTIQMIALAVFVILLVLSAMGLTNPVFTYSGVMDYLWIYLGIIASSLKDKLHVVY